MTGNSQWVPNGHELERNVCEMLHTPFLVWVSYSGKDDSQKAYKTKRLNAHRLVHSKHFFCVTVSTCHRQDQYSKHWVYFYKWWWQRWQRQTYFDQTQIKEHLVLKEVKSSFSDDTCFDDYPTIIQILLINFRRTTFDSQLIWFLSELALCHWFNETKSSIDFEVCCLYNWDSHYIKRNFSLDYSLFTIWPKPNLITFTILPKATDNWTHATWSPN